MSFNLDSIRKGTAQRAPRIILLGVEKIGKSTFAAGADNPIFIPVRGEEGIDTLDVHSFPPAQSPDDVLNAIGTLYKEQHDYKTVVIDSASALEPLIIEAACKIEGVESPSKLGGGYGHQDDTPLRLWKSIADGLDALRADRNMTSILIGHVRIKTINDPLTESYDAYEMDLRSKASAMLFRWADCILFANRKAAIRKEEVGFNKERKRAIAISDDPVLYTRKRPGHPGGGRGVYGHLPHELPLSWESFAAAVAEASKQ